MTNRQIATLVGCVAMLAVLMALPLVGLMSYRFGLADVLHKMPRLVSSDVTRFVGYVLLLGMALGPVLLGLRGGIADRAKLFERMLPALCALLLTLSLLLSIKPVSPAVGLWIYLVVALLMPVTVKLATEE
ncbi:MAG: hypothetical protein IKG77_10540 [Prevotella sp.]|nr:hypothetical protein [Prevotella sp.]